MISNISHMEINIHGLTVQEAKKHLTLKINSAPKDIRYITVIHGFNRGTALQQMVRKFRHERVKRIEIGLNNGETTFYLF